MQARNLDLSALSRSVNTFTLSVQDYQMPSDTIAKVMLTATNLQGRTKDEVRTAIAKAFEGQATPIENSFAYVQADGPVQTIVGFVSQTSVVRDAEDKEQTANMREMATNLLMDTTDSSLWETRKGSTGSYLIRQGEEDLSQLVHLAKSHKAGYATMAATASVDTKPREFASYVNLKTGEVDYGYITEATAETLTILPVGGQSTVEVAMSNVVSVADLEGEDEKAVGVSMPETAAIGQDKAGMIEYYRKAYSYAPEYVDLIIKQINAMSIA